MIDGLRQRLVKSIAKDPWDADQEFVPETEIEELTELPTDTAVIIAATKVSAPSTNDVKAADYYKEFVKTAMQQGGRFNDHQIPIPWLRMILAGLEYKRIEPETMWEGVEPENHGGQLPETPSYTDLFPVA